MMRLLIFLWLGCMEHLIVSAIDFGKVNMARLYNPRAEISFQHKIIDQGDHYMLYLSVIVQSEKELSYKFLTQKNYESDVHTQVEPIKISTSSNFNEKSFQFSKGVLQKLLVIEIRRDGQPLYYPILVKGVGFYLWDDSMIYSQYYSGSPSLHGINKAYAFEYHKQFRYADPPFGAIGQILPKADVDTTIIFSNKYPFKDWSFYLIQGDTNSIKSTGFMKVPHYYPKPQTYEELIGPLRYICTKDEYQDIKKQENPRRAFEQFWIKNAGGKSKAQSAIRKYYQKITDTNKLFTNYKEGWKTDQGMIHIAFGKPDFVYQLNNKQIWKYIEGPRFEFIRLSTLFADEQYTLVREPGFKKLWIQKVGDLRAGG